MHWKDLTELSRFLLAASVVFFVGACYTLVGRVCSLGLGGADCACVVLPGGAFILGNLWAVYILAGNNCDLSFLEQYQTERKTLMNFRGLAIHISRACSFQLLS
jgi:hypothetical protein